MGRKLIMNRDKIQPLVAYDSEWNKKFAVEKNKIVEKLPEDVVRIEHIGSTSVNGMEARPIVDIMIGLGTYSETIKRVRRALKDLNYTEAVNVLEIGERCFFTKRNDEGRIAFTALVVKVNGGLWRKKLEKKRILSNSEEARKKYIEFKRKSLEKCQGDLEKYSKAKEKYFS